MKTFEEKEEKKEEKTEEKKEEKKAEKKAAKKVTMSSKDRQQRSQIKLQWSF